MGQIFSRININQQVKILNKIIFNVLFNYIPNIWIRIDDKDPPLNDRCIKAEITQTNMIYQSLPKTIMIPKNFEYMTKIRIELFENIAQKKNDYHLKLSNKFR